MPLTELPGVGKELAAKFEELRIREALDLLNHFPYRYDDLRAVTPVTELGNVQSEENAIGTVVSVRERRARLAIVEAELEDHSGRFTAKWFGRRYLLGSLKSGMTLFVRGRVRRNLTGASMNVITHKVITDAEAYSGELVPIYSASKELTSRKIRQIIKRSFSGLLSLASDPLPQAVTASYHFAPIEQAYRDIHFPKTPADAARARQRFIFTEFLALALAAAMKRVRRESAEHAAAMSLPADLLGNFGREIAFEMTGAQRRVILEIWNDMTKETPMNRLLQGDVGSGKTLVAAAAAVLAARNGIQSALMAPTELLAAQHAAKLAPLLVPFAIPVEAVFGSQKASARTAAVSRIGSGEAMLAVGTHALLTEGVDFARLGLIIIDEQHRFGVQQRATLRAKGTSPHTLHMTATPIPRTLAQSVYADLDVSTIDELPPGRTPVETFAVRASRTVRVHEFIRKNVTAGHQAYVVAPAIDDSEPALTSVIAEAEKLRTHVFPDLSVGLLHGRMTPRDKEEVMGRFVRGDVAVLIATTVVEVGVDVPNASVMVVLDAHRYGLAQLHQLRGRVGRGAAKSYCVLVVPDAAEHAERLNVLTTTTDGFLIAEEDLRLRGPGEFAGTAQSGILEFKVADLVRDIDVYRAAKSEAQAIVTGDPTLEKPDNAGLRALVEGEPSARAMLLSS
ncbi:MAG: ATP-dependent DNA helicase RecG [Candidatus Eremiobacteraeota bacterium]|nr:ATP-dependent DNA helicase RecG [Candidatus Eremiobacteraeota bacterium]